MVEISEITAAQVGLDSQRQTQIVLETIDAHGGEATSAQIYAAVERYLPDGSILSQQGRDAMKSFISADIVQLGYIEPYNLNRESWCITIAGRSYLKDLLESSGVSEEDTLPTDISADEDQPNIQSQPTTAPVIQPFDPTNIRVDQRLMSVYEVMRKIKRGSITLQPDFQRHVVWNDTRKSRLIESVLLRIPLPAFYLDATRDDTWLVVDGLQRLSTIYAFFEGQLTLSNLEFITEFDGKRFTDFPLGLQRQIEDTELNLYIIRAETPSQVKFTIFSRVNTGGLVLTPQEIRHALFQGKATEFLADLARMPEFLHATTESINPLRMDDRECVLRFLAFHMTPYEQYGRTSQRDRSGRVMKQNLDGFLSETMERLNALKDNSVRLDELREAFRGAMVRAEQVFGPYAFRKMYERHGKRVPISKPLFETWSVLLLPYEIEALQRSREAIIRGFLDLMQDIEFSKAISLGTGSPSTVQRRFSMIRRLLEATVQ